MIILAIAGREVRGGLFSPLLWVVLGGAQIVLGWVLLQVVETLSGLEAGSRVVSLTLELTLNVFGFASAVTLLVTPLLAMRMLSSEFRDGSFVLIETAPVRLWQVVAGKYLGLALLMTPLVLLPLANLSLLASIAALDPGQLAAATLGLWLASLLFGAIGLYGASLTAQPGIAVIAAFSILLFLSIVGRAESLPLPPLTEGLSLFGWLSWNEHLFWFMLGTVRLSDLAYFGSFIVLFLALTHRRLANRRLS